MTPEQQRIIRQGLWDHNPALMQVLGMCPLLAVSSNLINGLGLGLATIFVMVMSNFLVSLCKHFITPEIRIPVFVILIASAVTMIEMLVQALAYPLYASLGIFLSLIVTNCVIIARAESFASKQSVKLSILDGLAMGTGFAWVLVMLGGIREILSQGTLFAGADRLFGAWGEHLTLHLYHAEQYVLLAALPPGAFICFGLMVAAKNVLNARIERRKACAQAIARKAA